MKKQQETSTSTLSRFSLVSIRNVLQLSTNLGLHPNHFPNFLNSIKKLFRFSDHTLNKLLEASPCVITMNEDSIRHKLHFFLNIGIQFNDLDRIFSSFPALFSLSVENKLDPLLQEFTTLGFSLHDVVRKEVLRDPRVLALEIGELSHCLKMLNTLNCRHRIKEDIFSKGAFRAAYEVKLRVDCLRKHGLISTDAFTVLWKEPRAIVYDLEDIEKKIDFLLNTIKYEIVCLVDVPQYLGVNFEKQIVPRYKVMQYLRSKGGIGDEVGLRGLIKPSRLQFYNLYVKPYPECETIYGRFTTDAAGVRTAQNPAGMWKLFKPQKFPKSAEDVMHIKSYVESLPN